jgi:hypothetical protein
MYGMSSTCPCSRGKKSTSGSCVMLNRHLVSQSFVPASLAMSIDSLSAQLTWSCEGILPIVDGLYSPSNVSPLASIFDDRFEPGIMIRCNRQLPMAEHRWLSIKGPIRSCFSCTDDGSFDKLQGNQPEWSWVMNSPKVYEAAKRMLPAEPTEAEVDERLNDQMSCCRCYYACIAGNMPFTPEELIAGLVKLEFTLRRPFE